MATNVETIKVMLELNASMIFLAPAVVGNIEEYRKIDTVNAYLGDVEYNGNVECPVFILYKPPDMSRFKLFYEGEKKTGRLKDDYDYPGHVMLVYSFPYPDDYQLFLEGRYSEMSEKYRKMLPKMGQMLLNVPQYKGIAETIETPRVWSILKKNPAIKKDWEDVIGMLPGVNDNEYFPPPDTYREIFDYSLYISTGSK
jgi:hypothetical protein